MQYVLDEGWKKIDSLVLFGFGKTAHGNIRNFINDFNIKTIIDNNPVFEGKFYNEVPILDFRKYLEQRKAEEKIVLLVAGKSRESIKKELENVGLRENIDYTDMDTFSTEWFYRFKNQIRLAKIGVSVTNRCTFNCKNCNMLMPFYKKPKDYNLDILKNDLGTLFQKIDFVNSFAVIGGEPLLYPELDKYLIYLGKHYREKIGNIQLITNGSIVPSDDLLKVIKEYDIEVRISDYTATISYEKKLREVRTKLNLLDISFIEFKQDEWIDFGFPYENVVMGETMDELRKHMLSCHGMCWWLHNGKIYYCSNAWSGEETGLIELIEEQDFIEIEKTSKDYLYDFYLGNMKNGYMTHCKRCRGFHSKRALIAAQQIKRVN